MDDRHAAKIHHINLVVEDLALAVERFTLLLGCEPMPVEHLPLREVALQRFDLSGTWLVLLTPTAPTSPAAAWLTSHGPGLFLLSFSADCLETRLAELDAVGIAGNGPIRTGLDGWQVSDLDPAPFFGIPLQLAAERDKERT